MVRVHKIRRVGLDEVPNYQGTADAKSASVPAYAGIRVRGGEAAPRSFFGWFWGGSRPNQPKTGVWGAAPRLCNSPDYQGRQVHAVQWYDLPTLLRKEDVCQRSR
jgi:hypothetical protein